MHDNPLNKYLNVASIHIRGVVTKSAALLQYYSIVIICKHKYTYVNNCWPTIQNKNKHRHSYLHRRRKSNKYSNKIYNTEYHICCQWHAIVVTDHLVLRITVLTRHNIFIAIPRLIFTSLPNYTRSLCTSRQLTLQAVKTTIIISMI